jgi:hypothetical protein
VSVHHKAAHVSRAHALRPKEQDPPASLARVALVETSITYALSTPLLFYFILAPLMLWRGACGDLRIYHQLLKRLLRILFFIQQESHIV